MEQRCIYINGRFLTQSLTGVHRYAYERCKAMKQEGKHFVIVCPRGKLNPDYDLTDMPVKRFGWGNSHYWAQLVLPWFFLLKPSSVLVCYMGLAPLLVRHTVMTIHDLSFLHNPGWYSKAYYLFYRMMTPICARHTEQIITVSNSSKKDILMHYPFLRAKQIEVIPPNIDRHFFCPANVKREDFVLAVSTRDPRKNLNTLIKVVSKVPTIHLKIVGGSNRVFADSDIHAFPNIELLGRVSDEELRHLYRTAAVFVYPSLFEGFGIPPLEALACGCPVAVSDIPVLHETCEPYKEKGEKVLYFNPYDEQDILAKLKLLLQR